MILQLPPGREERIAEGHEHVLMGMVAVVFAVHDDLATGHDQIDPYGVEIAPAVMAMRLRHDHMAAGDAIGIPLELSNVVERGVPHRLIDRQVIERHLRLRLHGLSLQPVAMVAMVAGRNRRHVVHASPEGYGGMPAKAANTA